MSTLTLDLSPDVYAWLAEQAQAQGKAADEYLQEFLESAVRQHTEILKPTAHQPIKEMRKEKAPKKTAQERLRAAGLTVELSDELRQYIDDDVPTLEEVIEILSAAGGPSLTEILDEQRGPKL